jgi:predicted membrane-bound spermidine synthase
VKLPTLQVELVAALIEYGGIGEDELILWLHLRLKEVCEGAHTLLKVEGLVVLLGSLVIDFLLLLLFGLLRGSVNLGLFLSTLASLGRGRLLHHHLH